MIRMLNGFPQTTENYDLLLDSYMQQLASLSTEAVVRAVRRYLSGDVPEQHMTFAPSVPEFVREARASEEYLRLLNAPKRPALEYHRGNLAPFEIMSNKRKAENANRPVLHEDVSVEQFRSFSAARQLPVGAKWVAGVIYGPVEANSIC
ncbi:hypothetical protein [Mesorhizobium loti]|nr:hypothetical protein [Mesorhizobium loti]